MMRILERILKIGKTNHNFNVLNYKNEFMLNKLAASELVLNEDGSVYHLNLLPEDIAEKIILVGDPDRVAKVSKYFDKVEVKKNKREFYTHTGTLRGERITVMSTGIGTENIDIVMNELDALVNIDLKNKEFKTEHSALQLFRMGTCGSVNPDVQVDNMLVTQNVVGLDGLMHFYQDYEFENEFSRNFGKFLIRKLNRCFILQTGQKNWENCTRMQNITEIPLLSQAFMLHREDSCV
jgi:hypothetical protein